MELRCEFRAVLHRTSEETITSASYHNQEIHFLVNPPLVMDGPKIVYEIAKCPEGYAVTPQKGELDYDDVARFTVSPGRETSSSSFLIAP